MDNTNIIERIKKLLAQAENTPFEAEATTALLMAQKLMAKYHIDKNDINYEEKQAIHCILLPAGRHVWWKKALGVIIADNFRCVCYNKKCGEGLKVLVLLGVKEDIEIAHKVYFYAQDIIEHHAKLCMEKRKRNNIYKKEDKNTYIMGYLVGIRDKFAEQVANEGWGLVLAKDNVVTEELNKMNLKKSPKSQAKTSKDIRVYKEGYEKGKNFVNPDGILNEGS